MTLTLLLKKLRDVDAEAFRASCVELVELSARRMRDAPDAEARAKSPLASFYAATLEDEHTALLRMLLLALIATERKERRHGQHVAAV